MISRHARCRTISVGRKAGGGKQEAERGRKRDEEGESGREEKGLTDGQRQTDKEKQGLALEIGLRATSDPGNYPLPACKE